MFKMCRSRTFYVIEELDEPRMEEGKLCNAVMLIFDYLPEKSYKKDNCLYLTFGTVSHKYVDDLDYETNHYQFHYIYYKDFVRIINDITIDESGKRFKKEYGEVYVEDIKHTKLSRYQTLDRLIKRIKGRGSVSFTAEFNRTFLNQMNLLNYMVCHADMQHWYCISTNYHGKQASLIPVMGDCFCNDKENHSLVVCSRAQLNNLTDVCITSGACFEGNDAYVGMEYYNLKIHPTLTIRQLIKLYPDVTIDLYDIGKLVKARSTLLYDIDDFDKITFDCGIIKDTEGVPFSTEKCLDKTLKLGENLMYGKGYDEFVENYEFG